MTSFRFLLLSAELPGEGVWCTATTYADCVAKVMEVWGSDFVPIFKYKLCCSPQGAEEELKYYRHTSHYEHHHSRFDIHRRPVQNEEEQKASSSADGDADHVDGANLDHKGWLHDAKTCEAGMMGRCYIVIDDERDFELWLHGGAALEHTEDVDAQQDTFHHANYHALEEHPHPLTTKLFAFRKTSMAVSCTTPSSAAATAAAHPHPMIHNGDASRGSIHTYYNTITSKDGIFRQRSSPAVKHGEDDVVRVPMHSMIPPLVLMKLGVSVVLRHSNASELILTTSRYSVGTEKTCWGNLMLKARSAWGVHEPIFRYVDLSQGYAQMNVANVLDYRFWSEGVGLDRRELVVLEHAPTKDLQCGAFMEAELRRHYAAHPPPSVAAPDKHALPYLIQKLSELERHHREESVQRPRTLPEIVADTREAERRAAELLLPPIHQQQQQQQQRAQPQPTQKQTSMAASGPSPTTTSSLRNGRVVPCAAPSTSSSSSTAVSSTSTSSPAEVHKKDGAPPAFLTDDETPRSRYKRIRQYIARVSAKIDGVSEEEAEEQRRAAELAQKQKEADEADVIVIESNHHEMMVVPTEDGGMLVLEMEVVPEEDEAIEEGEEEEEEDVAMEVVEALNDGNVLVLEMEVVPSDEGYYDDDDDDVTDEAAQEEAYPSQSGDNDEEYAYNSCVDAQPETNGMMMGDDDEEEVAASPQELLRAAYLQGTAGSRLCGGIAPAEQRYVSLSIREGAYGPSYSPAAMLDNPNRPDPTDADRRRREMELQRQLAAEHQLQLAQRFRRQREMAAGRMPPTATATRA